MKLTPLLFIPLFFIKAESNAQIVKVFESDSLNIYTNKDNESVKPAVSKLRFVSELNDSIIVCYNNKQFFSKFIRPSSSIDTAAVVLADPYIDLPLKNKKTELELVFVNEKIKIRSKIITGYKYLYIYKHMRTITLYYRNTEIFLY